MREFYKYKIRMHIFGQFFHDKFQDEFQDAVFGKIFCRKKRSRSRVDRDVDLYEFQYVFRRLTPKGRKNIFRFYYHGV